jgi:putative glutamine amidotransferase
MTQRRPILGIIACNRALAGETAQSVMLRYVRAAMHYADVPALIVPSVPDLMQVDEVVDKLDGLLLTGSPSNLEAHHYSEEEGQGPFDPRRDETALRLIDRFSALGRPIFGICRGFQEINVALGGTLRRDTSSNPDLLRHHSESDEDLDEMFGHTHPVTLAPGGVLHRAYGKDELEIISVHYQGIERLADGLAVEATAPDGLIEAFSTRLGRSLVVAVQWHPEWKPEENPDSQRFFTLLGDAMRGEV